MAGYIGSRAAVATSGVERKKTFAITTTTTSLTGLDYTPNHVHVFHNGIRLVDGTDYTATNGTSITLVNAAENGDEVVVVSYGTFSPADTYTKTEADDRYVNASGDTMTGQLGVGATDLNSNKVVIEGGNAGQHSSNLKLTTGAGTNGLVSDLSFYATFVAPTSDTGPRRTADITSGYATDNWGNEYLAIGVGGATDYANVTTERFRIDGAGRVTMPYQPAFDAYNFTPLVGAGSIVWTSTRFNTGNHFNTSTGLFTAPVSGVYSFNFSILMQASETVAYQRILFNINASRDTAFFDSLTGGVTGASGAFEGYNYIALTGAKTMKLNANDSVGLWNDSPHNTWTDGSYGHFSGHLIG